MKNNATKIIMFIHWFLLLWALLFLGSLFWAENGQIAAVLACGNILFLFANIPFSFFSVIFALKKPSSVKLKILITVLSLCNTLVSLGAWYIVHLISQKSYF